MIMYHGISFILLSLVILIVGMFKPKWILFWMDKPTRMIVIGIGMALFMVGAVLFGEGTKEKKQALKKQPAAVKVEKSVTETPRPEPKPTAPAALPAQAPDTSANELRP